jgi:hypothetical protein
LAFAVVVLNPPTVASKHAMSDVLAYTLNNCQFKANEFQRTFVQFLISNCTTHKQNKKIQVLPLCKVSRTMLTSLA